MSEATQILDAFFDRLVANDMVIVHRSVLGNDMGTMQRNALRNTTLTARQISEAKLWGDINPAMVRNIIREQCREGETLEVARGKRKEIKVIREAVRRVAKSRNILWLD